MIPMRSPNLFLEFLALAVMIFAAAEQERAPNKERAQEQRREHENRWDVKQQHRIDVAKEEAKKRFTPKTATAVCAEIDSVGDFLGEVADDAINTTSRKHLAKKVKGWERDLAALAAADRGLVPTDDWRVEKAKKNITEVVEQHRSPSPSLVPNGLDATTAGVLGADWEDLAARAKAGEEAMQRVAESNPETLPEGVESRDFNTAVNDVFEAAKQRRREKARVTQRRVQQTTRSASRATPSVANNDKQKNESGMEL